MPFRCMRQGILFCIGHHVGGLWGPRNCLSCGPCVKKGWKQKVLSIWHWITGSCSQSKKSLELKINMLVCRSSTWPVHKKLAAFENIFISSSFQHHDPAEHLQRDPFRSWWAFHSDRDQIVQHRSRIKLIFDPPETFGMFKKLDWKWLP